MNATITMKPADTIYHVFATTLGLWINISLRLNSYTKWIGHSYFTNEKAKAWHYSSPMLCSVNLFFIEPRYKYQFIRFLVSSLYNPNPNPSHSIPAKRTGIMAQCLRVLADLVKDLDSFSKTHMRTQHLPATPGLRGLTPSSGLWRHQASTRYTYIHIHKIHIKINKF